MGWQWHQLDHMQVISTSLQTDNHASTSSLKFLRDKFFYSFLISQSNINRFSKSFYCQLSTNTFYERVINYSPHLKYVATLPCEIRMLKVIIAMYTYFSALYE